MNGRPLGDDAFVGNVERIAGRQLHPNPNGRPRKTPGGATAGPAGGDSYCVPGFFPADRASEMSRRG
jgi:hypothetical protein